MTAAAPKTLVGRANAIDVFHALSDETRLAVVEMLRGGERCVCDLQDALDAAQSRLSFHLKVLKDAGLVTDRKEGRWSYYSLNTERLAEASEVLSGFATSSPAASPALHALARAGRGGSPGATTAKSRRVQGRGGCC
jgi:ArsR family transcriptional regulator, arsenate/arsenite/antimonite-responsive transcriptional repressor